MGKPRRKINMTKNMTRKGLAFGAGLALLGTSLVSVPAALAAVDDTAVSLTPSAGTQYSMVTDGVFDLKSTQSVAATAGSGNLKYAVTDAASISNFDYQANASVTSTDSISLINPARTFDDPDSNTYDVTVTASGDVFVISNPVDEDAFANLSVGDTVQLAGVNSSSITALDGFRVVTAVNANKDAFTIVHDNGANSDISIEAMSAGVITEVTALPFNGAQTATGVADILTMAYVASTDIVTITSPTNNNQFTHLEAGDIITVTGMNSAGITSALTGNFNVLSVTGADVFTFKAVDLKATDITTEDLGAGTFQEVSDKDKLDSYDILVKTTLLGGVHSAIAAPTRVTATGSYVIDTGASADAATSDQLRLIATAAGSVTVQAWIDENGDGVIDGTESSSSPRTVTFVTWANSGAAVAFETPVAGGSWDVYVTFNGTINAAQIPATRLDVALGVLEAGTLEKAKGGTTVTAGAFTAGTDSLVFNNASHRLGYWALKTAPAFTVASTAFTAFQAGYTYAAQIVLDTAVYGEVVYSTNLTSQVADTVGAVSATRGDNVRQASATTVQVKTGWTGQVEMKVLLTVADATVAGNPTGAGAGKVAVPEGTQATITVARGTGNLNALSTVTSGGKTLIRNGLAVTYTVTTDANGYATFSLSNNYAAVGDDLDVTVTHSGRSVTSSVIWTSSVANDNVLSGETQISINQKGSYSITYTAVDDFGAKLTSPNYRVIASYTDKIGAAAKSTGVTLNANGQGTLTVTDLSTSNGAFNVTGTLQKLNTSAVFADHGNPEVVTTGVTITSNVVASAVTAVATRDSTGGAAGMVEIEPSAGFALDGSKPNSATVPGYSSDEEFTIAGTVTNSANSFIKGALVTISAPGLLFNTGALNTSTVQVYTVGSITVQASNTGAYSVEARSNTSGAHTVTVTSGTAVKTVGVTFDAPLETNATQLTVSAPASTAVGSSFQAIATLTDVFGNPVATTTANKFTLSYAGKGMALTVPSDTGAAGTATFGVLVGSNDKGTGTITATYNGDGSAATTDDNITVVKTVSIGGGEVSASGNKVNAGSFKGYVALYAKGYAGQRMSAKVGKDWVVVPVLASNFERVVEFTGAGVDVAVRIYIDRVLLDTINLTTK
jgi:hypothetical protein